MISILTVSFILLSGDVIMAAPRGYNGFGFRNGYTPEAQIHTSYSELDPQFDSTYQNTSPNPYNFGYKIKDESGNEQHRQESGDEFGNVKGTYGYIDAYGLYRQVEYIADENGFRAYIKSNEPGLSNQSPANVEISKDDKQSSSFDQKSTYDDSSTNYQQSQVDDVTYHSSDQMIYETENRHVPIYNSHRRYY